MLSLEQIAQLLESAQRFDRAPELDRDKRARPGSEAVVTPAGRVAPSDRYVKLSDALALEIAESLRHHARGESPRAVALERR